LRKLHISGWRATPNGWAKGLKKRREPMARAACLPNLNILAAW
jgi:hypothetical protein